LDESRGWDNADYAERRYLSAVEAAHLLGTTVREVHRLAGSGEIGMEVAASGQQRFDMESLRRLGLRSPGKADRRAEVEVSGTRQEVVLGDSRSMAELEDGSVHMIVTSPPYFDAKLYSARPEPGDLGDVRSEDEWFREIGRVWAESLRVLRPGRRLFINIMNLPVRLPDGGFRTLNLVGRTIDLCVSLGFIFKRDVVWHKTNGVRAPFGTYPYPGGILLNNMHEFILEFEKPCPRAERASKYAHVPRDVKESSRLTKEFWLGIKNSDVWTMAPQASGDGRGHVAPFPAELPSRLIRAFTFQGETVLDPFLGSGTTLLAAAAHGRNGIGYEIAPDIARSAVDALRAAGRPP